MKEPVCNAIPENDRRQKPLVRAIALATAALFAPLLHAAPPKPLPLPANTLPVPMPNGGWLVSGGATNKVVGGNTMIIDQATQKAILDWKSFNLSKDAKVQFNQPSSSASTLNRINDQSASQIQGQISANGNIYLVNNNGILFSGDSKVNVHGLVASTLNIDANTYLDSSLVNAINDGKAAFEGGSSDSAMVVIDAYVDADQKVHAATIATDEGGQVLIVAPGVLNKGNIATPGGQAILAGARDKVYLAASDNNPDLRGLLVEVNAGGGVTNLGQIVAERGNITLLGLAINQSGVLRATTSVDVNGSIRLLARDRASLTNDAVTIKNSLLAEDQSRLPSGSNQAIASEGGALHLGAGSVTEVGVVSAAEDKGAFDAQAQSTSRIDMMAKTIDLESNSTVRAKGGRVNLVATATPDNLYDNTQARNDSRIYVGSNATIDVSGQKAELEMSSRVVEVELRADELKDAPLQRDGVLHGKTVEVDIDKGTPLVSDLAPSIAKIKHSVNERLSAGGTINMKSQGDVVMGDQAHLDISGGAVSYKSGTVETTKLLASNGQIVDIGSADPNRKYDGVFGEFDYVHPKWGKTIYQAKSFSTWREGFTQGKAGGALNIDTQTMHGFDRVDLQAGANTGLFQRAGSTLPKGGAVTIALGQAGTSATNSAQDVVIGNIASSAVLSRTDDYLDAAANGGVEAAAISASQLNKSGVGKFTLTANGTIHQLAEASIALKPGAGIELDGNGIVMDGRIGAPGGTIKLNARAPSDGADHTLESFDVVVASGSWLDTSGSWVNDLLAGLKSGGDVAPSVVNGGTITVHARDNLKIGAGSVLRSDAGAQLTSSGTQVTGAGGTIDIASLNAGAELKLDGVLSAYGFGKGGTLNLTAPKIDIGARPASADPAALWLGADFFTSSGFAQYNVKASAGDLIVHADAALRPRQQNLQLTDLWKVARTATGDNVRWISNVVTLPDYLRAPTSVSLATANNGGGDVRLETGASIVADPRATVALHSAGQLFVDGAIAARGGTIDLQITADGEAQSNDLGQMLWLGSHARLDASATRTARFSALDLLDGDIVDAGSVNLQASRGAVVAAPGSSIDVSGAGYLQDYVTAGAIKRGTVNAAAGSVALFAANGIAMFGGMKGAAAGSYGLGGSLTYQLDTLGRNISADNTAEYNPRTISVVDTLPTWDGSVRFGEALPAGLAFKAVVATDAVQQGGFTSLTLATNNVKNNNTIIFSGISFDSDVRLSLADTLVLGATNIALNDHKVDLRAPMIEAGQLIPAGAATAAYTQMVDAPASGTGSLSLSAKFIELLGNIGVGGAQRVALNSANDIRLRSPVDTDGRFVQSTFSTTGDLSLQASQVYGATLADYTLALLGSDSKFTYMPSGGARTPLLSAASKLTIDAAHIDIGGRLLAPLGTLTLNGTQDVRLRDGAVLDVSADNLLIPFGRVQGGDILWSYQAGRAPILIRTAPEKSVSIKAPVVSMDKGSQIDVSGGGDIYGIEQIPGTGGSADFLDPANSKGAFAVVPWLNSSISPYDAVEMSGFAIDGKTPNIGDVIYLDGGSGLAAGTYAILPAHYALLEGAYLITPKSGSLQPGQTATQVDGTLVVAGRYGRAFSNSYDSQWQSFLIEPGTAARTRSEYNIVTGDKFFAATPDSAHAGDAGRVTLEVNDQLDLLGSIIGAASQNGRKAQLDIVADQVEVVNARDTSSTAVQLLASDLNGVGVDSILLGGRRSGHGTTTTIDVGASSVDVRNGASLEVPDIVLAARDRVGIDSGATVSATGASTAATQVFKIDGDGALLRVSSAAQADISRSDSSGSTGVVDIAAGAKVFADYSVLIDSSRDMSLQGSIALKSRTDVATSLNLTANRISLGDGSGAASSGLSFSNAQLNSFNAQALRLSSRSGIDFYGDVRLDNQRVELNAGALRNLQGGEVQLRAADTIQIDNALDVSDADSNTGGGKLVLAAKKVVLGDGYDIYGEPIAKPAAHQMSLYGFDQVDLGAAGLTAQLIGEGNFKLTTTANVDVIADRVGGSNGSTTSIDTQGTGAIALGKANTGVWDVAKSVQDIAAQLGARLDLTGKSISQGTHIDLPSGVLTMKATGAAADDNVKLLAGSVTDVSGRKLVFPQGSAVASDGGEIHLASAAGDVVGATGAKVVLGGSGNVDGATLAATGSDNANKVALGGNSGLLDIVAKGKALWNAAIQAAAGSDAKGGNLQLDVGSFNDGAFSGWLQTIADSGIDRRIAVRSRSGDLAIDRQIRANDITVSADGGDVTLSANIDARGGDGGHVALWGGNDMSVAAGTRIDAGASADGGRGGRVELGARDGTLSFGAGSAIDVAGHAGAAGQDAGGNGSVLLRAPRTATNDDVQVANNGVKIDGAKRIELEAFSSYDASNAGTVASVINGAYTQTAQFMNDATTQAALQARFADTAPAGVFHVTPGIDIFSTGDLTLSSAINLSARRYGAVAGRFDGEAGVLSLRAAGDLLMQADLNDGWVASSTAYASSSTRIKNGAVDMIMRDFSWDYRLIGGADLNAANPNAVQDLAGANTGRVVLANGKDIVTGAAWINLVAGNTVDVQNANSLIAILGRSDFTTYANPLTTGPANELLPDTGSVDPYRLLTLNSSQGSTVGVNNKYPFYPKDGGDLTISAGSDVKFAEAGALFNTWMERVADNAMTLGGLTGNLTQVRDFTSWGVVLDALVGTNGNGSEGIVVLGGGNANVRAGADVTNLNAALPVTAKQVGTNGVNAVSIIGGGNLMVAAGGDVLSPRLWVDRGNLDVTAGGSFTAAAGGLQPMLALADTQVDIRARSDVSIGAAFNSTMMPISKKTVTGAGSNKSLANYFFTYADDASIDATSLQGDVIFANDTLSLAQSSLKNNFAESNLPDGQYALFTVYPSRLSATAINRNIKVENSMTLFPSTKGQLALLAGKDITMGDNATADSTVKVDLSDVDPALLPTFAHAATTIFDDQIGADSVLMRLAGETSGTPNPFWHAATPLHIYDKDPAIVAALGDIGVDGNLIFELAKPVRAYAGKDVRNITFSIQHSNAAQISEIVAGGDVSFPLVVNEAAGRVEATPLQFIRVSGPGRLDVIAGGDVDLGASSGIEAAANLHNAALPEQGANVTVIAGMNGPNALTDPILYNQFADRYFGAASNLSGSYIDWFMGGAFAQSTAKASVSRSNLIGVFTGKSYADDASAMADYDKLPTLTKQAIALDAYQTWVTPDPAVVVQQSTDFASLQRLGGDMGAALQKTTGREYQPSEYAAAVAGLTKAQRQQVARTLSDASSSTARLIGFVSLERFGGDLAGAMQAITGNSYADNTQAASALASLPAAQQLRVARFALDSSSITIRRELLLDVYTDVVRQAGAQQAIASRDKVTLEASEGYNRGYSAIESMFPGKKWSGDVKLALSGVRTYGDGDINIFAPGGDVDVGLANNIAGIEKKPDELGIIVNDLGAINAVALGSFNINQARMFTLGNGDATVWSSQGNVDAGKGAKTALSVAPPTIKFAPDGSSRLVYKTPVSGSGIQVPSKPANAADLGPLPLDANGVPLPLGDTRSSRLRYAHSLPNGNTYLFAPHGTINAGDAGISVAGNLLLAANEVLGAGNIKVGGVSVGVPTTTAISAGTLSLGNVASSATESATNQMNNAIKDTAAALAAGGVAFVTVDIIGVGQ